jgi:hypothetical protein
MAFLAVNARSWQNAYPRPVPFDVETTFHENDSMDHFVLRKLCLAAAVSCTVQGAPSALPLSGLDERDRTWDTLRSPPTGRFAVVLWDEDCPWCLAQMHALDRIQSHCPEHLALASVRFNALPTDRRKVLRQIPSSFHSIIAGPASMAPTAYPEVVVFDSVGRITDSWIGWRPSDHLKNLCQTDSSKEIP